MRVSERNLIVILDAIDLAIKQGSPVLTCLKTPVELDLAISGAIIDFRGCTVEIQNGFLKIDPPSKFYLERGYEE